MTSRPKFSNIDNYIASASAEVQPVLQQIRRVIHARVPDAETISYQMPAFKKNKVFIYFAAFKRHIGIYPPVSADDALELRLAPYRGEKGNLKFPLNEPMPYDLIGEVALSLSRKYS